MQVRYLEIVTKEVDAVCAAYATATGAQFGELDAGEHRLVLSKKRKLKGRHRITFNGTKGRRCCSRATVARYLSQ
jgi:hypothetical protein